MPTQRDVARCLATDVTMLLHDVKKQWQTYPRMHMSMNFRAFYNSVVQPLLKRGHDLIAVPRHDIEQVCQKGMTTKLARNYSKLYQSLFSDYLSPTCSHKTGFPGCRGQVGGEAAQNKCNSPVIVVL